MSFDQDVREIERHGKCPACGGMWSPKMRRFWHVGHPDACRRKIQDMQEASLRSRGMVVQECGCTGTEHSKSTCLRWFALFPEQEIGEEYAGGFDG
jgi:hypothetical protein